MTVAATPKADWHLRGEWFDVCSCKLPCPCSFAQEPTHGDCLFTLVWQIHEGHYGTTDLSGLGVVALGEFAGNMWVGDPDATMKLMFYIDEKADADQRAALERIFRGDEGGWPGEFGSLISELRGIEYAPINFAAADDLDLSHRDLLSGAGHDAQELASICPTAMVFVPGLYDGISHNPREYSTPEACTDGVSVLATVVRRLAG